jgi:N-methylhydantoinase B
LFKTFNLFSSSIRAIPDGPYRQQIDVDGFDHPIVVKLAITVAGEEMFADYTGTSPPVDPGNQRGLQI